MDGAYDNVDDLEALREVADADAEVNFKSAKEKIRKLENVVEARHVDQVPDTIEKSPDDSRARWLLRLLDTCCHKMEVAWIQAELGQTDFDGEFKEYRRRLNDVRSKLADDLDGGD